MLRYALTCYDIHILWHTCSEFGILCHIACMLWCDKLHHDVWWHARFISIYYDILLTSYNVQQICLDVLHFFDHTLIWHLLIYTSYSYVAQTYECAKLFRDLWVYIYIYIYIYIRILFYTHLYTTTFKTLSIGMIT